MNNQLIYITGANGFVGQNLRIYLSQDFDINGVSRNKSQLGITYQTFFESEKPFKAMVHLAGKAHDLKKTSNDKEYYEVNFELTKKLYDHFLQSDANQFIYISSVKAVADTVPEPLTEDVLPNPITAYGKSKRMAEEYILSNLAPNKRVFILRPCMIHGPGNKGNLNLLFGLVSKGLPWPLGAFDNNRSFLSVENLCFVIREILGNELIPSGVYNIADDEPLSTNKLIQLIANSQNKEARILSISKKWIVYISKIGSVLKLPLNTERLHKLTETYVVSNSKITQAIGKSLPIDSKEGMLKTFQSFNKL